MVENTEQPIPLGGGQGFVRHGQLARGGWPGEQGGGPQGHAPAAGEGVQFGEAGGEGGGQGNFGQIPGHSQGAHPVALLNSGDRALQPPVFGGRYGTDPGWDGLKVNQWVRR